ncbi:hypothetical protein BOTBODRAFT_181892 [Botryobasidium botryosum FD-172 SS1]|uniref:Uncharacterized protein n=1 Tax=Botryobasidium botryosum (strain FD-172 SS1) TaxID=930990 RepID=A0A067LSS5_BOTB1|nr:hypothetical protein BOTBODRAFT_181892 [Botryobasidium botryosum FD-172 SS1]
MSTIPRKRTLSFDQDENSTRQKMDDIPPTPMNIKDIDMMVIEELGDEYVVAVSAPPSPPYLLAAIVRSHSPLNQEFWTRRAAKRLIEEDASLRQKLEEAWAAKDFEDIRRYPRLQVERKQDEGQHDEAPMPRKGGPIICHAVAIAEGESMGATEKAWKYPFQGSAHKALLKRLRHLEKTWSKELNHYAKFVPLIQSSGTGKSRLLDEMAKEAYVIPLNIRDSREKGYPLADPGVLNFLTTADNASECEAKIWTFLRCLLDQAANVAIGLGEHLNPETLRAHFLEHRASFYTSVLNACNEDLNARRRLSSSDTPKASAKDPAEKTSLSKPCDTPSLKSTDAAVKPHSVAQAAQRFSTALRLAGKKGNIAVICIDEVHTLTRTKFDDEFSPFATLHRVIRELKSHPIFCVVLSTNTSIHQITSSGSQSDSSRVESGHTRLYQPFVAVGFDHLVEPSSGRELIDCCRTEYIASFGRPLFAGRYRCGTPAVQENITTFAFEKLTACGYGRSIGPGGRMASIAVRIPLDILPRTNDIRGSAKGANQEEQVERHLRMVISIDPDQGKIITAAPSEPILAEAAAMCWHAKTPNAIDLVAELVGHINNDCISKGDSGELFVALLTLMAHDSAAFEAEGVEGVPTFHTSIPLLDFLHHLFPEEHIETVLSTNDDTGATIKSHFKDAMVHFTHFIQVRDPRLLEAQHLAGFMMRGIAIVCVDGQHATDLVIPMSMDGTLEPAQISALKLQIKTTVAPGYKTYGALVYDEFVKLEDLDVDMELQQKSINILFSLGADPAVLNSRVADPKKDGKKRRESLGGFNIYVGGCTHDIFKPLSKSHDDKVKLMLRDSQIFPAAYTEGLEEGDTEIEALLRLTDPSTEYHPANLGWLEKVRGRGEGS